MWDVCVLTEMWIFLIDYGAVVNFNILVLWFRFGGGGGAFMKDTNEQTMSWNDITESLMVYLIHPNRDCLFSVKEWGKKLHVGRGCTKMRWKESLRTGKNEAKYTGQRYQQTSMNGPPQERNGVWKIYNLCSGGTFVSDIFLFMFTTLLWI